MQLKAGLINKLARPLGVEIELAKVGRMNIYQPPFNLNWHWEEDGTLTPGGKELVGRPCSGDDWAAMMAAMGDHIHNCGAKVDKSCGLHVHVQASDLKLMDIRRLIKLWCAVEKEVFTSLVASERRENKYCYPMSIAADERREAWQFDSSDLLRLMRTRNMDKLRLENWLIKKLYGLDLSQKMEAPPRPADLNDVAAVRNYNKQYDKFTAYQQAVMSFNRLKQNKRGTAGKGCRYSAMNVHAWFYRGKTKTIEFRCKEGTIDPEELIFWPLFCGWFVESATRLSDSAIMGVSNLQAWLEASRGFAQPQVLEWISGRVK